MHINEVRMSGFIPDDQQPQCKNIPKKDGGYFDVCSFTIVNEMPKRGKDAQGMAQTYVSVKAFNETAKYCGTLRPGNTVIIFGKWGFESWDDKNGGGKRSKNVLEINSISTIGLQPVTYQPQAQQPQQQQYQMPAQETFPMNNNPPDPSRHTNNIKPTLNTQTFPPVKLCMESGMTYQGMANGFTMPDGITDSRTYLKNLVEYWSKNASLRRDAEIETAIMALNNATYQAPALTPVTTPDVDEIPF